MNLGVECAKFTSSRRVWSRPVKKLRCMRQTELAWVAQLVERVLGKDEVTGSIPVPGSRGCRQGGGNSTGESRSSKAMVAACRQAGFKSRPGPRNFGCGSRM